MIAVHARPLSAGISFALTALLIGSSPQARADTEIIDPNFSTCTVPSCSSVRNAAYLGSYGPSHQPWVGKFLAIQGNCLRLQVAFVGQPTQLEMVVVGPGPLTRYRSIAGYPLVKIDPAPASGFYTVMVSSATGAAINTDFHLVYGQYNAGNVNCSGPTSPVP